MNETLEAMHIRRSDRVDPDDLLLALRILSTSPELTYAARLDLALAIQDLDSQDAAVEQCLRDRAVLETPQGDDAYLEWFFVELSLRAEPRLEFTAQAEAESSPSDDERDLAHALAGSLRPPFIEIDEAGGFQISAHEATAGFASLLNAYGLSNGQAGLIKTALLFADFAARLLVAGDSHPMQWAANLSLRGVACRRLEHFERARAHHMELMALLVDLDDAGVPPPPDFMVSSVLDAAEVFALHEEVAEAEQMLEFAVGICEEVDFDETAQHIVDARVAYCYAVVSLVPLDVVAAQARLVESLQHYREVPVERRAPLLFGVLVVLRSLASTMESGNNWADLPDVQRDLFEFFDERVRCQRPDFELEYGRLLATIATIQLRKEREVSGEAGFGKLIDALERHRFRERPHMLPEAMGAMCNEAMLFAQKDPGAAVARFENVEQLALLCEGVDPDRARQTRAALYQAWAAALRRLKEYERALTMTQRSLDLLGRIDPSTVDDAAGMMARTIATRGSIQLELGNVAKAGADLERAIEIFERPALLARRDLVLDRMSVCVSAVRLLGAVFDSAWAATRSGHLAQDLAAFDPDGFEGQSLWTRFRLFHSIWLSYCVDADLQEVPRVLLALQGRNAADRLKALDGGGTEGAADRRIEMKSARDEFRIQNEKLREDFARTLRASITGSPAPPEDQPDFEAAQDAHRKYVARAETFHAATRDGLAGTSTTESRFAQATFETLAGELKVGEVLACFVDLPAWSEDDSREDEGLVGVWVLEAGKSPSWISLKLDLDRCLKPASFLRSASRGGDRMREGPVGTRDTGSTWSIEAASEHIAASLWSPTLAGLTSPPLRLNVVTLGRFHLFPFELGCPLACPVRYFPGLAFFAFKPEAEPVGGGPSFFVLENRNVDLPYANAEGALVARIWQRDGTVAILRRLPEEAEPTWARRLHLCGHGGIRGKHRRRWSALHHGSEVPLEEQTITRSSVRADGVWVSACVVGHVQEDAEGDPAGMIIPLLLQGNRCVVACLVAVPDRWMPLLVGLTEWLASRRSLSLPDALKCAKVMLPHWTSDPTLSEFQEIYRAWVASIWGRFIDEAWWDLEADGPHGNPGAVWRRFARAFLGTVLPDQSSVEVVDREALQELLVDNSLVPPLEARDILCNYVRAFGQ